MFINDSIKEQFVYMLQVYDEYHVLSIVKFCIGSREATTASLTKPINRAVFELHAQAVKELIEII